MGCYVLGVVLFVEYGAEGVEMEHSVCLLIPFTIFMVR